MKKIALSFVLSLSFVGCDLRPPAPPASPSPPVVETQTEKNSPAEKVTTASYLSGATGIFDPAAFKGKVLLLDVCAPWSPASRIRVAELGALAEQLGGQGLAVVGLVVDGGRAPEGEELAANYPLVSASQSYLAQLGKIRSVPACRLYDRKGKERKAYDGYVSPDQLRGDIATLLAE